MDVDLTVVMNALVLGSMLGTRFVVSSIVRSIISFASVKASSTLCFLLST